MGKALSSYYNIKGVLRFVKREKAIKLKKNEKNMEKLQNHAGIRSASRRLVA